MHKIIINNNLFLQDWKKNCLLVHFFLKLVYFILFNTYKCLPFMTHNKFYTHKPVLKNIFLFKKLLQYILFLKCPLEIGFSLCLVTFNAWFSSKGSMSNLSPVVISNIFTLSHFFPLTPLSHFSLGKSNPYLWSYQHYF